MTVDWSEVYRYMGVKGEPDEAVAALAEQAVAALRSVITPRFVRRRMALHIEGDCVRLDDWNVVSADLSQHLTGCDAALLFAATLGSEVDRLLSKDGRLRPALAVAEQAAAAAMIEQYCDDCCKELAEMENKAGRYLRPRFSPGYGDFSIDAQPMLLSLLDAQRRIGLSVTESRMLTPIKSVTAVIGLTPEKQHCHTGHCARCPNQFCVFRKDS